MTQARTGPMPTTGRWGWYRDHEGSEFRRVSKLIKKVETDTYNLDLWKQRQVAEGLALRDDLVLSLKAMGRPDVTNGGWSAQDKKKINGIVNDAMSAAKQRDGARTGTAVHDLTERLDRGESVDEVTRGLPATPAQTLRAYDFLRRENGWKSIEIERTVVCDELEVAGSFDRVDLIPGLAALLGPGTCQYGMDCEAADGPLGHPEELPVIADVKTEESPWLNGLHIAPQLAIYSRSRRMWRPTGGMVPLLDRDGKPKTYPQSSDVIMVPDGEYVPAPCVRQDIAVVVHLHAGDAVPIFVNLTEGWEAAQAAYAQINREARAKRSYGSAGSWFAAVPNVKRPAVTQMLVETAAAAGYGKPQPEEPPVSAPAQVAVRRPDGMVDWAPVEPWHIGVNEDCANCAPLACSATRVDGTEADHFCATCGRTALLNVGAGYRTDAPTGAQVAVAGIQFTKVDTIENVAKLGALDTVDRQAIETIWSAHDTAGLSTVWDIYVNTIGRPWVGRVAEAAEARRAQIECPQRQLHTAAHGGRCACGWDPRFTA